MIKLSEKIDIAAPLEEVWPILSDPTRVVACVPGMTLSGDNGQGTYEGTISVKFGPTVAIFRGQSRLSYDHEAKSCDIEAGGIDQKGSTRASASAHIVATGTDETTVVVNGGFNVTGPLAQFARTGGVFVARALLADFAANLTHQLDMARGTASATEQSLPGSRHASGFRLLRTAFVSWVRHLFGRS